MPNAPEDNPDPIEKSLGDEATGADVSRVEQERSLGDQSTSGDALSSMSDLVEGLDADPALRTLAGHTDAVWSVAFSPRWEADCQREPGQNLKNLGYF